MNSPLRLASFSVDLDEIGEYFAIHGLDQPTAEQARMVYQVALPRLLNFATAVDLPVTLFVVGRDVQRLGASNALMPFVRRGDELGNHSHDHRYNLTRLSPALRREQVERGGAAIQEATGVLPRGFRAPGYTLSDGLVADLQELGYAYDSSLFTCPPYYAAKAASLALGRLRGRRSAAILDSPRVLFAPTQPYRVGDRYRARGAGLREIPISVTPGLRLPYIGTTLSLLAATRLGPTPALALTRMMERSPVINLELHGIDFLDVDDGLQLLASYQHDLRVPWRRKLEAFSAVVGRLRTVGYRWSSLLELHDALG